MQTPANTLVSRESLVFVVIDVQHRLAAAMPHRDRVVERVSRLARCSALVGAPIIVTRQYPKGLGGTVEEIEEVIFGLAEHGGRVTGVDKTAFCCASEPDFMEALSATGRNQVVLAGMETHICVAQTALALSGAGYEVQVAADACCSRDDANHDISLARMRSSGIVVTCSESVMYEAVGVAATPEFKQLLEIVKD